jgi:hypothetical protein
VTLQVVASLMIVILTTLEVSFTLLELPITLLENIYSTGREALLKGKDQYG